MACFFDGAFAGVAVLIGAVVVHDDGAAGADELVHAFPGFDPRANAEGFELPDGAFEIPDKHLQKLFAVDGMPVDGFKRGHDAVEVGVIGGVAIDVDADSHREGWAGRILCACVNNLRENPAELAFAVENVVGPLDRDFWCACAIPACNCIAFLNVVESLCKRECCNLCDLCEVAGGDVVERN